MLDAYRRLLESEPRYAPHADVPSNTAAFGIRMAKEWYMETQQPELPEYLRVEEGL